MYDVNPEKHYTILSRARKLEEEESKRFDKGYNKGMQLAINKKAKNKALREIAEDKHKDIKDLEEIIENLKLKKDLLGDSIENCRKYHIFSKEPTKEYEVEALFLEFAHHLGFYDLRRNAPNKFPDLFAKFEDKHRRIELEKLSGNFIAQKHDPTKADILVCWRHNTKQIERLPKEIIELKSKLQKFYYPQS